MLQPRADLGNQVKCFAANASASAGAPSVITAGGGLDNVKVTGQTIDNVLGGLSGVLVTEVLAALGAGESATLASEIQESADGSNWDTAEVLQAATSVVASAGGGNVHGFDMRKVSLVGRKRYVRFNMTLNLSRANTDTASFSSLFVVAGHPVVPPA